MKYELLQTVRQVAHADSDPVRQALFEHVRSIRPLVRWANRVYDFLGPTHLSTLAFFLFGAMAYAVPAPASAQRERALVVAVYENACQQAGRLATWIGEAAVVWLRLGRRQLLSPATYLRIVQGAFRFGICARLYRLVHRLNRRYGFFVGLRTTGALFCYVRAREILRRAETTGVIVASDSNPEPLAFARAATALGVPTIFIAHAFPASTSPALNFTLSILEGEAALSRYREKGPVRGQVIFLGVEGASAPMHAERLRKPRPTIGIFPPKVVRWPEFGQLLRDCRRLFKPSRILIRWHPSMLGPSQLKTILADLHDITVTPPTDALPVVARHCDWAIADENSSVHLGLLKSGVPTLAMREFSVLPESRSDLYGFVQNRVIPPPVAALSEVSLEATVQFYSLDWDLRFRDYDAGYGTDASLLVENVRAACLRVLAGNDSASLS